MTTDTPTPRTDAFALTVHNGKCLETCDSFAHDEKCPVCHGEYLIADFARQLERELTTATETAERQTLTILTLERELAAVREVEAAIRKMDVHYKICDLNYEPIRASTAGNPTGENRRRMHTHRAGR